MSDGRIAVLDGRRQLRIFSPNGEPIVSLGGPGRGPGEFANIAGAQLVDGDSIYTFDSALARAMLWTGNGEFVRMFPAGTPGGPSGMGILADGTVIWEKGIQPELPTRSTILTRSQSDIVRTDQNGAFLNSVGVFPGDEMLANLEPQVFLYGAIDLLLHTHVAVGPDRIYVATNDRNDILILRPNGEQVSTIARVSEAPEVTPDNVVEYVNTAGLVTFQQPGVEQAIRRSFPDGRRHPAILGLMIDDAGNLWVEEAVFPLKEPLAINRQPKRFSIYSADGVHIGRATLPPRLTPLHIGSDFVLGVFRDSLDVETVRLHRLIH